MGDHDRDAILARRALFMSAALAGLACTTRGRSDRPESELATGSVESPAVVVEIPKPLATEVRPSWSEVMAAAPPLDVPEGLTDKERDVLTSLATVLQRRYQELGEIWDALPQCSPSAPACAGWAQAIEAIHNANDTGWGPLCGYPPAVTDTYVERERVHDEYITRISEQLLADLDSAVEARANPADSAAWKTERAALERGYPRACLRCAPRRAEAITEAVRFAQGEAKLADSKTVEDQLAFVVGMHRIDRNYRTKLIVRGHASADEADPESLGRQRAEAVAEQLVGRGVDRRNIEVRSYAASLPITNDPAEAALNRRVDFEVVVP